MSSAATCPPETSPMLKPGDYIKPTGRLITGTVFDCDKRRLEKLLKDLDAQLYLKWNPKKRGGWGCWEVRRKPNQLTKIYQGSFQGQDLYTLDYKESDIINHILDLPYLSYDVIGKLKSMDAWSSKNFMAEADYAAERHKAQQDKANREELRYNIKQFKREWREFATLVSQGVNPGKVLKGFRVK